MVPFIMLIVFISAFHLTLGSTSYFYVSEVANDAAAGFASSGSFICTTIMSLTTESMINSNLKVIGTIWYYTAWSVIGTIFCYCFVRESRGLTDYEKKNLYTPEDLIEDEKPKARKLELKDRALTMAMTEEFTPTMVSTSTQTNCSIPTDSI